MRERPLAFIWVGALLWMRCAVPRCSEPCKRMSKLKVGVYGAKIDHFLGADLFHFTNQMTGRRGLLMRAARSGEHQ